MGFGSQALCFCCLVLLSVVASCAGAPREQPPGPLVPGPIVASAAPQDIAVLILDLGSEEAGRRDGAAAALARLGQEPSRQTSVVAALRGAATSVDPEIRLRARETLKNIDRSESIVPGTDRPDLPMAYSIMGGGLELRVKFWHRLFADGSSELEVEINGGPRELFSGGTPAELALRVNDAARKHGYPGDQFEMLEDGTFRFGNSSISGGESSKEHLIRDWGLWVSRTSRSDGFTPSAVWGGWVIQARALSGKAFASGIQQRDVILEVDGKKAATARELSELLNHAQEITLLRLEARRVVVTPR